LGTVYAQCGGIFGVAAFVDRCMDKWMADPTLNSNEAVATWHVKAQRCGFKFLVVQIVGQLTGGPQKYTGRPMDEAHKHLNISAPEWERFMEIFNEVCEEFQLPSDVAGDLNALMISMEDDCVIQPGERAPPNPGPARHRGSSIYARCGGVYPLALFADRLVDALLQDDRVRIPHDEQKRTEVSLKYLFTEMVCNVAGGPEVITAKDFDETKLLLPNAAWEIFISTAQTAVDHMPNAVRAELVQQLQRSKNLIIDRFNDEPLPTVALGQSGGRVGAAVKDVQTAAAGKMLTSAAIAARYAAPGAHIAARRRVIGDPRTLYGRGGGVFGLAKLSSRLMDAWMEDTALNANAAVSKWHESQQKFGFKFLVTQLLGYLTGGPQRYTGQPMEIAHMHLAITEGQWKSFIADAGRVFGELRFDADTQSELLAILASFKDQCVLKRGQAAPEDPKMCRARPNGSTAYAQLGGVYPIALFADRVVEAVLAGDRVQVEWNRLDDPAGTRHPPGLKYMFTELFCNSAGGPEVATSKGFDEAKLGINPNQWPAFLALVAEAAAVWPTKHHKDIVLRICAASKVEICAGLEGEVSPGVDCPVPASDTLPRCPFSGNSAGQCPFSGAKHGVAASSHPPPASKPHGSAGSESIMEEGSQMHMVGKVLGSSFQRKLDDLLDEDPDLCCPVSLMVFAEPVIASDGFIYERSSLMTLLRNRQGSPMTREALKPEHRPAQQKKLEADDFRQQRCRALLQFAREAAPRQPEMSATALERAHDYLKNLRTDQSQALALEAAELSARLGCSA